MKLFVSCQAALIKYQILTCLKMFNNIKTRTKPFKRPVKKKNEQHPKKPPSKCVIFPNSGGDLVLCKKIRKDLNSRAHNEDDQSEFDFENPTQIVNNQINNDEQELIVDENNISFDVLETILDGRPD